MEYSKSDWKLEERIKKDTKHPDVILQMRKSEMVFEKDPKRVFLF